MKIYILYLLKNILKYFILIVFTLTSIIWITRTIRYLYFITEFNVDLKDFLLMICLILPDLLLLSIPISIFLSIVFLYNKLIKNNELIILQNTGVDKNGFLKPVLFVLIFVVSLSYSITLYFSPKANIIFNNQKKIITNNIINVFLSNMNFNSFDNITFYAKSRDENLLNSIFFYIRGDKFNRTIYAKKGEVNNTFITFNDGNIQEFNDENKYLRTIYFDEYSIDVSDFYKIDYSNNNDTDSMFLGELFSVKNKDNKIKMEIFNRIFTPILSISLSILSCLMILNVAFSRFDNNKSIFIIYLICLINFVFYLYFMKISKKNEFYLILSFLSLFSPIFYNLFNRLVKFIKVKRC